MLNKLLILIIINILNLTSNANENNDFKLEVNSISLNTLKEREYLIKDYEKDNTTPNSIRGYFSEIEVLLEEELKKQNYTKSKWCIGEFSKHCNQEMPPKIKIGLSYIDFPIQSTEDFPRKFISIEASMWETNIPLWEITAWNREFDTGRFRIFMTSAIKCLAPYFNKNFKGIVTCQR